MSQPVIKLSRSMIADFKRCRKKYQYRYLIDGDKSEQGSGPMSFGTLGHWGLAEGYRLIQDLQSHPELYGHAAVLGPDLLKAKFQTAACNAMQNMIQSGVYYYRGEEKPLGIDPNDSETINTALDVIGYYTDHRVVDDFTKYLIVSVEQEYTYTFEVMGRTIEISGVFDLCAQDLSYKNKKMLTIFDHKFKGVVDQAMQFLPLDTQMLLYEVIAWHVATEQLGYDDVELVYNCVRRDVPPGYGGRPLKTKSGRLSTASQDVADYLRRELLFHSPSERDSIDRYFQGVICEMLIAEKRDDTDQLFPEGRLNGVYYRSEIQTGGEACGQCAFKARCAAELVGKGVPKIGALI